MDVDRFTFARLFFGRPRSAHPKLPLTSRRLRVVGTATAGIALVVAAAGACSSGGGGGGGGSSSPIVICEDAATSGPFASLGTNAGLGVKAWAAMVNKAGGLLGHQVQTVVENNASNPATAAAAARKCVQQDHATFIFGPETSGTMAGAIPIANQLKTVEMAWGSGWNGQGISDANLHAYAFPSIGNVYFADDLATVTQLIVPRHYTRVSLIEENTPGGLSNLAYVQSLQSKYGFQLVASQIKNPGSTNDTPQVLNLLKVHPDIIMLGITPGPDTITFLKAVRAQDPNIPIGECSACTTTQFVNAVGGPTAMKNIYLIGSPESVLQAIPANSTTKPGLDDTKAYIAAMKAAGMGSPTEISEGGVGWAAGRELQAAVEAAKSIKTEDVKNALEHQTLVTGGIQLYYWARTPADHSAMTRIDSSMVTVGPDGSFDVVPFVGA
jgi:ABC-type branched-subunit amino acid transport system substrate-binding protein